MRRGAHTPPFGRRSGFTVVELLVVVGIIALLMSLLLPALGKARAQARLVACQSNLRQIGTMMLIYANENGGWLFPPDRGLDYPISERWFVLVLKSPKPKDETSVDPKDWVPAVMRCPADDPEPAEMHSYVVNDHLIQRQIKYSSKAPAGMTASRVIVMGEKVTWSGDYYMEVLNRGSDFEWLVEKYRHGARLGSNYLYMDLHVDTVGPDEAKAGIDPWDPPTTQPGG